MLDEPTFHNCTEFLEYNLHYDFKFSVTSMQSTRQHDGTYSLQAMRECTEKSSEQNYGEQMYLEQAFMSVLIE